MKSGMVMSEVCHDICTLQQLTGRKSQRTFCTHSEMRDLYSHCSKWLLVGQFKCVCFDVWIYNPYALAAIEESLIIVSQKDTTWLLYPPYVISHQRSEKCSHNVSESR